MNVCMFVGRFAEDPKISEVNGTYVVNFTLAVETYRKSTTGDRQKIVGYFDFEAWDSGAVTIEKSCRKGDLITVKAEARQHRWTSDSNEKRQKVVFRVESFKVMDGNE